MVEQHREPLQFLPVEQWSELQEAFRSDWPRGISGYYTLETQRRWIQQGVDYGFKVFCPFGDVWSGMVAINEKGLCYEVGIQCPKDDTTKLENALRDTKLVDWKKPFIKIPHAPHHIKQLLQRIASDLGLGTLDYVFTDQFILAKTKALFEDISLPPGVTFELLTPEHVDLIDSKWPHQYAGSSWYFQLLVKAKSGFGLFKNKKLMTWIFVSETGFLLHLFTLEQYRRKRYAELLTKIISNNLMREGKDAFAFAVKGNDKSVKLFASIGFENFGEVAWCFKNNH